MKNAWDDEQKVRNREGRETTRRSSKMKYNTEFFGRRGRRNADIKWELIWV